MKQWTTCWMVPMAATVEGVGIERGVGAGDDARPSDLFWKYARARHGLQVRGDTSICRAHHFAAEPSLSRDRQWNGFRGGDRRAGLGLLQLGNLAQGEHCASVARVLTKASRMARGRSVYSTP